MLSADTIYTLKLRRRGVSVDGGPGGILLHSTLVSEVMTDSPDPVSSRLTPTECAQLMLTSGKRALPVLHRSGEFIGIVTVTAVSEFLGNDDSEGITISALIEKPLTVDPDATLDSVLDSVLAASDSDGMPVTDAGGMLRGWLTLDAILRTVTAKGRPRAK